MSSMIVVDVVVNAMVAGAKAGAGADDVVCVRDIPERDLSRNSTIAYKIKIDPVESCTKGPYLCFRDGFVSTFYIICEGPLQRNDQCRHSG